MPSYFHLIEPDHWNSKDLVFYYVSKFGTMDQNTLLRQVNIDLKKAIDDASANNDMRRRNKAEHLLGRWKEWKKQVVKSWQELTPEASESTDTQAAMIQVNNHGQSTYNTFKTTISSSERGKKRQADVEESNTHKKSHVTNSTDADVAADTADADTVADIDEKNVDVTSPDLMSTLTDFLNTAGTNGFHKWRLENYGIFQIGNNIRRQTDVPDNLYDELALDVTPPEFPVSQFEDYLRTTLFHDAYGTAAVATAIFSTTHLTDYDASQTNFIMRALFILSENVHCRDYQPKLNDSEVSYCHYALWPFIRLACNSLNGIECEFKVGETYLKAMDCLPKSTPRYSADGTVYLAESGLELLLFESSGSLDTMDRPRHAYDHLKGAYGCYVMLMAILTKYPYADKRLMSDLRVLFLHAGANGNYLRLWVMKPCFDGSILTFERMDKVEITTSSLDKVVALKVIKFFWKVKGMLERSMEAIDALRLSNDMNFILSHDSPEQTPLLPSLLKPTPIKPIKGNDCAKVADLEPVSSLF